ncbi:ClpP/crotonase [Auricularia subglabra TFB-10046 SS5]|uniref:ClpP/crotonase n=1 Tax=Auricularia subglabra (strain TFB-10046 / SS5) TaxID=717982 RepID=J0WTZ9_AURST|nr:ClpP/crotonase [Auricularia subglabra TFB-10046 SS5]
MAHSHNDMIGRSMLGLTANDDEERILLVDTPEPHVLVLTMNRPDVLNAMSPDLEAALARELDAFERDDDLWVAIIAGKGRMFCAGADLAAWKQRQATAAGSETQNLLGDAHGFGALSRRIAGAKPVIAAVHGGAYGGGTEIVLNADLVVAEEDARFALPEALRGVVAAQGGIPRIAAVAGHQLASEMLLTGRAISAKEAYERFRFVNEVVPRGQAMRAALALARRVCAASPDAARSSKRALQIARSTPGAEAAFEAHARSKEALAVYNGRNIKEGLAAFVEKRKPVWTNPAKL